MKRGPKPKSSAAMRESGAYAKNPQRENHHEPVPVYGEPVMPRTVAVDPLAVECWRETCDHLREMKLLATADGKLLEQLAVAYACFVRSWEVVRDSGVVITGFDDEGNREVKRNPAMSELKAAQDMMRKLLPELGLTPSSRTRLKADPTGGGKDMFSDWLERGGLN